MKGSGLSREEKLAKIVGSVDWAYVPRFYEPIYAEDGAIVEIRRLRDDVPAGDRALRDRRPGRNSAARPAGRAVRRDGARPHRHRDHARLPLAVPLLPEHGHQATAAFPHRRDDRRRGPGDLPEHRLRRDQPAFALDQRLPRFRALGDADERGLHAAGGARSRCPACGSTRRSRRSRRCSRKAGAAA